MRQKCMISIVVDTTGQSRNGSGTGGGGAKVL